ncbi:DUF4329 domain-containing protein [Flavobacterium sediminilitoris]|uniref:DUF4329 domain-containing protein n=1 Tax=Flavobacterium sediminilitoris TaxID=2024526 RepID=A0ABY4HPN2_9FLAO|nr:MULTISPECIES: DUF4329 domain-containing protein [Flavobacterium]UOX34841.1 DUF4329 domain-containing protein [Flavobacterium sediminilitoris]
MRFLLIKIVVGTNTITYIYNATGQKVSKIVNEATNITQTNYLAGGFQYKNNVLQFFPHAEGYVKHEANNYSYVFNYTDHLGNIRLSYSTDPSTKALEILEENNYYPFGLKHANYNMSRKAYYKSGGDLVLEEPCPSCPIDFKYNYKYQEQERQDELGLNWDSFKWRNYDYAIGRFMNIDPLAEDYPLWTPYAFSGNRVVDSRELEGLEPHTVHSSLQEASRNFSQEYNGYSIHEKREISTQFYKNTDRTYSYATPKIFLEGLSNPKQSDDIPVDATIVGEGHTR